MWIFLLKGLLRDRQRSLFPILSVSLGVFLVVAMHCWMTGMMEETLDTSARFDTGHLKIVTKAYAEEMEQMPLDLALVGIDSLFAELQTLHPHMDWTPRIRFSGLLDVPDSLGETRIQGIVTGIAVDLFSPNSLEQKRLHLHDGLVRGRIPQKPFEILLSEEFSKKLNVHPGDKVTLIGTTMDGAMAMANFTVSGTLRFGVSALDRAAMIADLRDVQHALDMENAASEIVGFFPHDRYDEKMANSLLQTFSSRHSEADPFSPKILRLVDQQDLEGWIAYIREFLFVFIFIFVLAMSLVLWNAGLLGGIRRYGEIGIRLALGESSGHIFRTLLIEALLIGTLGSLIGTTLGLALAWFLQTHGLNIGYLLKEASLMIPNTLRARITPPAFFIGWIPGLFASLFGTGLAGMGIYRRKTSELFKELQG